MTRRDETAWMCPNCAAPVQGHPENGCVLAALIGVVKDRGRIAPKVLQKLHANADVDRLWDALGPIVDGLERGEYSV